jgi:hypothetical protein
VAGMTGRRVAGTHVNSRSGVPAVKKKAGAGGGQQPAVATTNAPQSITYTWIVNAANSRQMILTFSQPVIWSGGIPTGWTCKITGGATGIVATGGVSVNSPTQVTLTFTPSLPASGFLTIPQNDPTFKGTQGQFLKPGPQFAGPQK